MALGITETHKQRSDVGQPPSSAYLAVSFRASDGGLLSSWTPKVGDGPAVRTLLVAPGGNVIAGGQFATIGSLSSSTLSSQPGSVCPVLD